MNANRGVDRSRDSELGFERHPIDAPSIDARIHCISRIGADGDWDPEPESYRENGNSIAHKRT